MKNKIESCKTMPELDALRLEIAKDIVNFTENQRAFIKKKNQLLRIPLRDRNQ